MAVLPMSHQSTRRFPGMVAQSRYQSRERPFGWVATSIPRVKLAITGADLSTTRRRRRQPIIRGRSGRQGRLQKFWRQSRGSADKAELKERRDFFGASQHRGANEGIAVANQLIESLQRLFGADTIANMQTKRSYQHLEGSHLGCSCATGWEGPEKEESSNSDLFCSCDGSFCDVLKRISLR
uniref:Uncharacterized protein n=1 Tax=Steinernema glaseri TaxID=37863 RepID=A0A1I7Z5J7_9BILA